MLPVQPLAIPPLPSLVTPPSLSLRCASLVLVGCCITSSLIVPPSLLHRLFVELPHLSPHCRLSLSRISRFVLLPQRRRCHPTQFAATGLPPPSSRRRLQFKPTDPPPPPSHIHMVDVDVIDDNIIQPPHDHRELPHRAVQSEAGITDSQRTVMPHHHCDTQFLEQCPGAQGNAGPRPAATAPAATAFAAAATVRNGSSCTTRVSPRRWDADRIQFPPIYRQPPPLPHPPLTTGHVYPVPCRIILKQVCFVGVR